MCKRYNLVMNMQVQVVQFGDEIRGAAMERVVMG